MKRAIRSLPHPQQQGKMLRLPWISLCTTFHQERAALTEHQQAQTSHGSGEGTLADKRFLSDQLRHEMI